MQFWGGVELFFVISGYLITGILIRDLWERNISDSKRSVVKRFYVKRATRLIPAATFWALVILIISFAFRFPEFGNYSDNRSHFLAALFFVENIYITTDLNTAYSIYWSLSNEEQYYLILPLLLLSLIHI